MQPKKNSIGVGKVWKPTNLKQTSQPTIIGLEKKNQKIKIFGNDFFLKISPELKKKKMLCYTVALLCKHPFFAC